MTIGAKSKLTRFREKLRGRLLLPDDVEYDRARRVWNGVVDKRPAMIAYCAERNDVIEAITFARSTGLELSVRSGGHNVAGNSLCEGGLVVDLSMMKKITVDSEHRFVRAEAGLTLGEFDVATQAFGLATTMGVNSDTGIAGLTLGGGFGKLGRRFGLACDNLLAADVVTADGQLVRASAAENDYLLWGVRGGGGNFGIVTAFEYSLHPVGPQLLAGSLVYGEAERRDALRRYYEFSYEAADEISADAALMTSESGERLLAISVCYCGPLEQGERILAPLRNHGKPIQDQFAAVPYLHIQSGGDDVFPRGRRYYWKAQFMREITDAAVESFIEAYAAAPSPTALAVLQQVGGAIARIPPTATAYGGRDASYDCFPISIWDNPADDAANIQWARNMWTAMQPFSNGVVYVNNLGEEGENRVRAAYGPNYEKLVMLKNKYDPTNLFHLNQNVRPTP
jgi:FAD/FMN-containing dehydrogenase